MAGPRGATRRTALQQFQQPVNATDSRITQELDATTTVDSTELAVVARKVSFQATGDLAGNVEVSINGVNFVSAGSIPASNAIASYEAHLVKWVRVTRTGGSGKLHILVV